MGKSYIAYVGTYTSGASEGIYRFRLDPDTGDLRLLGVTKDANNPSYIAVHPTGRHLYTANEVVGEEGGHISAFSIDNTTGNLTRINGARSTGNGPCYVSIDRSGRFVLVANYTAGSIAALPLTAAGAVSEATGYIQHAGMGPNPKRQEGPHAHCIISGPDGKRVFAVDLGLDRIFGYHMDPESGAFEGAPISVVKVEDGAGPRHLIFDRSGVHAFVINELNSTITVFPYDAATGSLHPIQTVPTLPDDFSGENFCGDIHLHPSGRFLYGSNRGHDSIAMYRVDASSGLLTLIGYEPTQGEHPRNFVLDPDGKMLLVANKDSGSIVVFRVDQKTGHLTATGRRVQVPDPACIKLLSAEV